MRDFRRAARAVAAIMRINEQRVAEHRGTLDASRRERAQLEEELRALLARGSRQRCRRRRLQTARRRRARRLSRRSTPPRLERAVRRRAPGRIRATAAAGRKRRSRRGGRAGRSFRWPRSVAHSTGPCRADSPFVSDSRPAVPATRPRRNGIEIAAPDGTPVRAIHPGTVSYASPFTAFGNLVIVDHGRNAYSLYGYLASMAVDRWRVRRWRDRAGPCRVCRPQAPLRCTSRCASTAVPSIPYNGCGPDDDGWAANRLRVVKPPNH